MSSNLTISLPLHFISSVVTPIPGQQEGIQLEGADVGMLIVE
jgi:hypothetical protein